MKIGILADIHGNIEALKAVLKDIELISIDQLLIAGDFVGYYYHPREVVSILREMDPIAIKGNHEIYFEQYDPDDTSMCDSLRSRYGSGLARAHDELTGEQKAWLSGLDDRAVIQADTKSILLCHGSPWDINQYIYPNSSEFIWRKVDLEENEIIVMGHTHYPFYQERAGKIMINPGSVGQSRNGVLGANWALLDTADMKVEIRVSKYNIQNVIDETKLIDPDMPYLGSVLRRGEEKVNGI